MRRTDDIEAGSPARLMEGAHQVFVESVRDYALIMLDTEGFVRSWNAGAERIKGYRADEIMGEHFSRFYPPGKLDFCAAELRAAAAEGRFEDLGWRVRKDGTQFFANVIITAVRDASGALIGFGKVTRDITEKKRADDALRDSEERFRLLTESVRDYAIFMLDPTGRVASWNRGAEVIKRLSREEVLGEHFSRFYPPEDVLAGKCERLLEEAQRDGSSEDLGWRVRKDGTRFFAHVVITAMRAPDGALRGYSKVVRDLTERRWAEESLRQSEERFRLLVESVSDYAIFMLDVHGNVASWNAGAERTKGYLRDEIIGHHFSRFYPPEDVAAGKCELELRGALAQGRFEDEGWRVRKDGTRFWANVVITPIRAPDGSPLGFGKVTRDLTAARHAETARLHLAEAQAAQRAAEERARERGVIAVELEELNSRLKAALASRDDFLAVASHELRTPLHILTMQVTSSQFLIESGRGSDERLKGRLDKAQAELQRLDDLLTRLLDVSRIATGRMHVEPVEVDLVATTRTIIEREKEDSVRSGCAVSLVAPDELRGEWDPLRLDQIITNLLSNAMKYGDRSPVTIELSRVGEHARIVVADRGLGIDPADRQRIFERFERAVSPRNVSGFGLGLWIVRQILDCMAGEIHVEGERGQGSRFVVELPLRGPPVPEHG